jgi:hypothetical protein
MVIAIILKQQEMSLAKFVLNVAIILQLRGYTNEERHIKWKRIN